MGYNATLGEIITWSASYVPQGYADCDGSLLSTSQFPALFSLLGTTYGGNGITTFALPDLRGRFPLGAGEGTGLTRRNLGDQVGAQTVDLPSTPLPESAAAEGGADVVAFGGTPSVPVMPPYGLVRFAIATRGDYPMRP